VSDDNNLHFIISDHVAGSGKFHGFHCPETEHSKQKLIVFTILDFNMLHHKDTSSGFCPPNRLAKIRCTTVLYGAEHENTQNSPTADQLIVKDERVPHTIAAAGCILVIV
jgi:hypothetical protein